MSDPSNIRLQVLEFAVSRLVALSTLRLTDDKFADAVQRWSDDLADLFTEPEAQATAKRMLMDLVRLSVGERLRLEQNEAALREASTKPDA